MSARPLDADVEGRLFNLFEEILQILTSTESRRVLAYIENTPKTAIKDAGFQTHASEMLDKMCMLNAQYHSMRFQLLDTSCEKTSHLFAAKLNADIELLMNFRRSTTARNATVLSKYRSMSLCYQTLICKDIKAENDEIVDLSDMPDHADETLTPRVVSLNRGTS